MTRYYVFLIGEMMKSNEIVWRVLADAALNGRRSWENIADLAHAAAVPPSNAQFALRKLTDIGAVKRFHRGGFSTTSPEKIITLACAWRSLEADTVAMTSVEGLDRLMGTPYIDVFLGGPDAAVFHLGGLNTIAHISKRVAYIDERELEEALLPPGDDVRILRADKRALRDWDVCASPAQTIADLFATPGWQASEFRLAMTDHFLSGRDWDQEN